MKKFNNLSIMAVLIITLVFGFTSPNVSQAATTPSLGVAATFGVLADTFNYNIGLTTITGDLGMVAGFPGGGASLTVSGATQTNNAARTAAGVAQNNTLSTGLAPQACTFTFASGAINLATDTTHGQIGVYAPGVYCINGAATVGTAGLTLNGAGTYIFRIVGSLNTVDNSHILSAGASSCDVFWTPTSATTLGANTTFIGNVIDASGITVGSTTSWLGRALAYGGTITTDTDTIDSTCTVGTTPTPAVQQSGNYDNNTITIFKQVINDNGGTATYTDFPLFINGSHVSSGQTAFYAPGLYTVSENNLPGYASTFTGNCDSNGIINHGGIGTHSDICTIVNNDIGTPSVAPIPPLIDVLKTASPASLPSGPGLVKYTYTLKNIGTVPVTNITMIGDTCSPINLISGDINADSKLDVSETWVYTCSKVISVTHKNTVVATGHANGLTAVDVASAIVVVGSPIVPPLIHIVKTPNILSLPSGGGNVTYNYTVTNPGTAPLSNVYITDDKCTGLPGRVVGHPGDLNKNNLLESNESWSFTCQTKITKTTTNTAIASGSANSLIATDFALATVTVATPKLPKTGFPPEEKVTATNIAIFIAISAIIVTIFVLVLRKKRS